MKILCLFWKLQISYLTFQGWSWVRSFFGGHVPSPLLLRDIRGGGPRPLSHGAQARADGRLWVAPLALVLCTLSPPLAAPEPAATQPSPLPPDTHLDNVQLLHTGGHPERGAALAVQIVCNTEAAGAVSRGAAGQPRPHGQVL